MFSAIPHLSVWGQLSSDCLSEVFNWRVWNCKRSVFSLDCQPLKQLLFVSLICSVAFILAVLYPLNLSQFIFAASSSCRARFAHSHQAQFGVRGSCLLFRRTRISCSRPRRPLFQPDDRYTGFLNNFISEVHAHSAVGNEPPWYLRFENEFVSKSAWKASAWEETETLGVSSDRRRKKAQTFTEQDTRHV